MSVDLGRVTIYKEFEALKHRWNDTGSIWKDVVRQDFEKDKWSPMEAAVLATLSALDRLAPVLVQIREDCDKRSSHY
jgi:hypothetical protein